MTSSKMRTLAGAALVALTCAAPARADAIDGDWCYQTQSLTIKGPQLRTPAGSEITGDYGRHSFNYAVPANEPAAGTPVAMQLMSDDMMTVARAPAGTPLETWRRCKPIS